MFGGTFNFYCHNNKLLYTDGLKQAKFMLSNPQSWESEGPQWTSNWRMF